MGIVRGDGIKTKHTVPFKIDKGIPIPDYIPRINGLKAMAKLSFNLEDMKIGESFFYPTYKEGQKAILIFRKYLSLNNINYTLRQAQEKKGLRIIRIK